MINQQLEEFKERLRRTVKAHTVDQTPDEKMEQYARQLSPEDVIKLVLVLNGQYRQLTEAVLNQK